jgi:hypothetical protein
MHSGPGLLFGRPGSEAALTGRARGPAGPIFWARMHGCSILIPVTDLRRLSFMRCTVQKTKCQKASYDNISKLNTHGSVREVKAGMRVEFMFLAGNARVDALVAEWRHFVGVLREKYQLEEEDWQEDQCERQHDGAVA